MDKVVCFTGPRKFGGSMVDNSHLVVAIIEESISSGTEYTINYAKEHIVPVLTLKYKGET